MRNRQTGVRWMAALGAVALLAFAGSAVAGQPDPKVSQLSGVQAHVDPATGQLRQPAPAEMKAYVDAVRKAFAARVAQRTEAVTQHADGSRSLALGADTLNIWVATIGPDGSLSQACVEGAEAAAHGAPVLEVK